uniref:Uncharacterized protein n=1 Tax=Arion vulgaris TaxID=1028688 RepID=A0A0B6ZUD1_9EUPU
MDKEEKTINILQDLNNKKNRVIDTTIFWKLKQVWSLMDSNNIRPAGPPR